MPRWRQSSLRRTLEPNDIRTIQQILSTSTFANKHNNGPLSHPSGKKGLVKCFKTAMKSNRETQAYLQIRELEEEAHSLLQVGAEKVGPRTKITLADKVHGNEYKPPQHSEGSFIGQLDLTEVVNYARWRDQQVLPTHWAWGTEIRIHPAAVTWASLPWWPGDQIYEMWVYTDGSVRKGRTLAGAAAAVWVRGAEGWQFAGAHTMQLPAGTNAHRAELVGILLALTRITDCILARGPTAHRPRVRLIFDAVSAGYKASGEWSCHSDAPLVKGARGLMHMPWSRWGIRVAARTRSRGHHPGHNHPSYPTGATRS